MLAYLGYVVCADGSCSARFVEGKLLPDAQVVVISAYTFQELQLPCDDAVNPDSVRKFDAKFQPDPSYYSLY